MITQQQRQLLHLNHQHSSQLTLVILVVIGSLLMGLVPSIYGLTLADIQEADFIIPTEAELWSSLGKAID